MILNRCELDCNSCENGHCIEPNKCICNDGYVWNSTDAKCSLTCENSCVNGFCSEPNNCVCHNGFKKSEQSHVCIPFTYSQSTISESVSLFSTTENIFHISPTISNNSCINGYRTATENGINCEPICTRECEHGVCVQPDSCKCNKGHEKGTDILKWNICYSVCDENTECFNKTCTSSGLCECVMQRDHNVIKNICVLCNGTLCFQSEKLVYLNCLHFRILLVFHFSLSSFANTDIILIYVCISLGMACVALAFFGFIVYKIKLNKTCKNKFIKFVHIM